MNEHQKFSGDWPKQLHTGEDMKLLCPCARSDLHDHESTRTAVQPNGCPHPTLGARLSEQTLWRMHGENAVHGNALPAEMQHALCPSSDSVV
jgi:hypothetical protein